MEAKTSTMRQVGVQSTPIESDNATTRIMLEAARVAVANALAKQKEAASTREREDSENSRTRKREMWVKSQDGKLFNLGLAYGIHVEDRGGGQFVVAEYASNDVRSFNLTLRGSQAAAQNVQDEIEVALSEGRALLNLKRDV